MGMVDPGGTPGWPVEIAAWTTWLRAAGRPPTTIYLRTYQLRRFAAAYPQCHPWQLTVDELASWLGSFDWKPETRRSYRASLRTFYDWAHITGRIAVNPARLLPTIKLPKPKPRPAPDAAYEAALEQAGPREWMMLRLAGNAGMRRAEIAQAHSDDLWQDLTGHSIRIVGKGGRVRNVPLLDDIAAELLTWPAGYLFPGAIDGHLSPAHVGKVVSRLLPPGWTAHNLRHRFGARTFAAERDIRAVQELLGHANLNTTQIYTPVPDGALRAAVQAAA